MQGLMQNQPLLISSMIEFAAHYHGTTEVVSRRVEGDIHRTTWAAVRQRSKQLAQALDALGLPRVPGWPALPGTVTATWRCTTA